MTVVLIRHAHCVNRVPGLSDGDRHLTSEGRAAARRTGEILASRGVTPTLILTSPLVRAVQTAEIIATTLGYEGEVIAEQALFPMTPAEELVERLASVDGTVIAVGHAPDMSARSAALLGLRKIPMFSKSMALCVERGSGGASFGWAYLPRQDEVVETLAELE